MGLTTVVWRGQTRRQWWRGSALGLAVCVVRIRVRDHVMECFVPFFLMHHRGLSYVVVLMAELSPSKVDAFASKPCLNHTHPSS